VGILDVCFEASVFITSAVSALRSKWAKGNWAFWNVIRVFVLRKYSSLIQHVVNMDPLVDINEVGHLVVPIAYGTSRFRAHTFLVPAHSTSDLLTRLLIEYILNSTQSENRGLQLGLISCVVGQVDDNKLDPFVKHLVLLITVLVCLVLVDDCNQA
jgi:hypothetical protein